MALLRIFQRHKKSSAGAQPVNEVTSDHHCSQFSTDCLRLIVFREGDRKERRLLFDSSCVRPRRCSEGSIEAFPAKLNGRIAHSHSNPGGFSNYTEDGYRGLQDRKFEVTKAPSDTKVIGEMIFGAVSMSFKGDTLKLHETRSPPKVLLTKVFPGPKFCHQSHPVISESSDGSEAKYDRSNADHSDSDRDSQYSTVHSLNELVTFSAKSVPICIPETNHKSSASSSSPSMVASGLVTRSTSHSSLKTAVLSPVGCKSLPGTPMSHSLQRRWLLNSQMSLESGVKLRSNEYLDEEANPYGSRQKRSAQIGIAVLISFPVESDTGSTETLRNFIFSHIFVIENELDQLQEETTKACSCRALFMNMISKAWFHFCQSFERLFTMERLTGPVWLSLMSKETNAGDIADRFLSVFIKLVSQFDVKSTNFFVSTLLTSVLLNHLTWVSSVAPVANLNEENSKLQGSRGSICKKRKTQWIENRDISHPYNPLWMQFLDVIGGTLMPSKITRFLVTGSTAECVNQFIYLLSYFLRCSDVNEAIVEDLVGREFGDEKIRTLKEDRISSTPSLSKRSRHSSSEIHTLQTTKIPTELSSASKKPKELRQDLEAISQRSPSKVSNDNSQNSSCSSHAFSKEQAKELAEKLAILQSSRERNSDVKESGILDGDVNCDCTCGVKNKTTLPTSSEDFASPGTSYFAQDYLEAHTSEFFNEPSRPAHKMLRRRSGGENFCSSQGRSSDALNPFFIRHKHLRSSGSEKGRIFGRGALKQRNFSCPVFRGSISQSPKASVNRAAEDLVKRTVKARHNPPIAGLLDPGDKQLASSPPRNSVIRSVPVSRKVSTADGIIGSCGRFDVIPISAPVNIYEPTSSSTVSSQCTVRYAGSIDSLEVSKQNETGDIADFAVVSHKTSVTLSTRKTSLGYGTGTDPSVSASILCTHRTSESIGMGESAIEEQICPDFYQLDSEGNRSDADSLADNSQSQLDGQHTKYSVDSGIEENDAMDFARSENKKSLHDMVFGSASVEPLPNVTVLPSVSTCTQTVESLSNLGRSALAPYSETFQRHCVLSGCRKYSSLAAEISEELNKQASSFETTEEEPIESVCVIADTNDWCVKVMSNQFTAGQQKPFVGPASLIINMIDNVKNFRKMHFPSDFCLTYIEESLSELYLKSSTLLRYLDQLPLQVDSQKLAEIVECDVSDLPLLISVASAHSPEILCMFDTC